MSSEIKIECPRCTSNNCFEQELEGLMNYLCIGCGFTSNGNFQPDSEFTRDVELGNPQIVNALKFYDASRDLNWYPSVINTAVGMIFPEGDHLDWHWKFAPIVKMDEEEQKQYPILGQPGEFYETRLGIELGQVFDKNNFPGAIAAMGVVKEEE